MSENDEKHPSRLHEGDIVILGLQLLMIFIINYVFNQSINSSVYETSENIQFTNIQQIKYMKAK